MPPAKMQSAGLITVRPDRSARYGARASLQRGVRSASLGVDQSLLLGPAQGVRLVLERLCGSPLSFHQNDDHDVLCVRHQPRFHDVLAALEGVRGCAGCSRFRERTLRLRTVEQRGQRPHGFSRLRRRRPSIMFWATEFTCFSATAAKPSAGPAYEPEHNPSRTLTEAGAGLYRRGALVAVVRTRSKAKRHSSPSWVLVAASTSSVAS